MSRGRLGYPSLVIPLNIANVLTLLRILMVPVMVLLIVAGDGGTQALAAVVFLVAALTDVLDGHLARSRNLITRFGRIADPLADKLLVAGALVALVAVGRAALWFAAAVIAREVAVSALRWFASGQGIAIAVNGLGKAKTGAQMTAIPMLMLIPQPDAPWVVAVLAGVAAITVASGLDYAAGYARASAIAGAVAAPRP